ncbi:Membrane protein involved in the export of O-antigen and teichoic acid [Natribacillus halophilus]|uniref:Membrane protein involved in the export of O-antigen and teichoic acid n=2 Tax=Natribacillus halophilus TaxID=549003 RepID=A0A1G8NH77_9BACI|nr:Membrane protein involved in the export of O-antigen and teichoic acid [Natribacillus halophilus]
MILMADTKLVRGTMLLTSATMISRFLGLIYIFPFTILVGQQGNALYQYGYLPYQLLLSLATMGVPMAISKFVSKYNALDDYHTGQRLFRSGLVFMTATGFIAFLVLFLMAPVIAGWVLPSNGDPSGNSHSDVVFTIRMVSIALLIIPGMAVLRGYFQGFQSMGPTAVSQVIEQVARILFILATAFIVLEVFGGSLGLAVGLATFGAFIGGLSSLFVLLYFWRQRKAGIQQQISESKTDHQLSLTSMYKELIVYALPLSFVGLAIPLFQVIDMFTFNDAMAAYGANAGEAETAFGVFSRTTHALIMIPVAIATAMAVNLIPAITEANTNRDVEKMHGLITKTFQIILFFTIPAAFGLAILATPAFASLYGLQDIGIGSMVLSYYAPAAILFSIFAVTAAMLQGMNRQKYAVAGLCIGLFIKLGLNYGLIASFGALGGVSATIIGYTAAIGFNVWAVGKFADYRFTQIGRQAAMIMGFTAVMAIAVYIVREGGAVIFDTSGQAGFVTILIFGVLIGMFVYLILAIRTGLAEKVIGNRFAFMRKR